jgi:hypothetical protein
METKGEINISPNYNKDSYLNLKLSLKSRKDEWNTAISIIRDRIDGRYFNQIQLLSDDINANGFTIMALNCLLIETLYQFKEGKDKTPTRNKDVYSDFLVQEFPSVFNKKYCGIFLYQHSLWHPSFCSN